MSERTEYLGQRVELRQRRKVLVANLEAQRDRLRILLNPVDDPAALDGDAILDLAMALAQLREELGSLDTKLAKLAEILGD